MEHQFTKLSTDFEEFKNDDAFIKVRNNYNFFNLKIDSIIEQNNSYVLPKIKSILETLPSFAIQNEVFTKFESLDSIQTDLQTKLQT